MTRPKRKVRLWGGFVSDKLSFEYGHFSAVHTGDNARADKLAAIFFSRRVPGTAIVGRLDDQVRVVEFYHAA